MFILFFTIKRSQLLKNLSLISLEEVSFDLFFLSPLSSSFSWQNRVLEIFGFVMSPNVRLVTVSLSTVLHCHVHLSFLEIGVWTLMMLQFLFK